MQRLYLGALAYVILVVRQVQVQIDPNLVCTDVCLQGDQEKDHGRVPIPMMDRERAHELPANQVGF